MSIFNYMNQPSIMLKKRLYPLLLLVIVIACKKNKSPQTQYVSNTQHVSVATQHNDNYRTGWNSSETVLNTSNVNETQFGKLFTLEVDDQVYAQPLVVGNLDISGKVHNVVFIATVNNSIYAFDADNGNLFWQKNYTALGMRPPRNTDMGSCGGVYMDFSGNIGIVGTPVIDTVKQIIYFVARSTNGTSYLQHLHAVNILTGAEMAGSPTQITASYTGNGDGSNNNIIPFNSQTQNQRQALTLVNGMLYISWSSHCDIGPYHGWIIGYNASTLQQQVVYNTTPDGGDGGLWQSGMGLAADESGNLYAAVGNGTVGANNDPTDPRNRSESALKLSVNGSTLAVTSYFTPSNFNDLNNYDLDFGSIGSLLIPNTHFYFTGSKNAELYLLNRDNMGGYNSTDQIQQTISLGNPSYNEHCQAAYYKGATNEFVYVWSENDELKAFPFNRTSNLFDVNNTVVGRTNGPSGQTGAMLSVSSNGNTAGTGILWASFAVPGNDAEHTVSPGVLYAFDANDVTKELWNSSLNGGSVGNFAKFSSPTIANGHVYLATFSSYVNVFGLK
jgi:hypothetical protein